MEFSDRPLLLIVEDDDVERIILHERFKQIYYVEEATNGYDALKLCVNNNYDLILLDLNLPILSGLGLLYAINTLKPNQKVVVLSNQCVLRKDQYPNVLFWLEKPYKVLTMDGLIEGAIMGHVVKKV